MHLTLWQKERSKPASLKLETFSHAPEVLPPLSELLLWHFLFQNEQKLFLHSQVSLHLQKPTNEYKLSTVEKKVSLVTLPFIHNDRIERYIMLIKC